MLRIILFLASAAALAISAAVPARADCPAAPQPPLPTTPLTIETLRGAFDFTVEIAVGEDEKSCGLMRRPRLAADAGMLFRQSPPGPSYFWMKNTPQPLDMVFLDDAGRVVYIAEHTIPFSTNAIGTNARVAAVLELRAGMATRLAIDYGDQIRHDWFKP